MEDRAMFEAPQVKHPQQAVHIGQGGQSHYIIHLAVVKNQQHHHCQHIQVPIAHIVSIKNENWQVVGRCPGFVPGLLLGEKLLGTLEALCTGERM
jgi:hypothetical protein